MTILEQIKAEIERLENYYTSVERHIEALISFLDTLESEKPMGQEKEVNQHHRTRNKLAEWSKTPEGRMAYEKVAEEMRKQIVPKDLEEAANKYATEWHENPDGSAWKPYFEVSAIKAFIAGAKWQKEQKPAEWSEVELEFRGEKVKVKRPFYRDDKGRGYSTAELDEEVAWNALRAWCEKKGISLYDLYPKAEWSEEDEKMIELIRAIVFGAGKVNSGVRAAVDNWLKSLRPQYHGDITMTEAYKMGLEAGKASSWKPSEEQMKHLEYYVTTGSVSLKSLYEQLKKL